MEISPGAAEIIREARLNPYDKETIVRLVNEHGLDVAVEAILILAQVRPGNPGAGFVSRPRSS